VIPVVFTHYGLGEKNFTVGMPQVPQVGDSIHLGDDDIAIARVFAVRWCFTKGEPAPEGGVEFEARWHAEVAIR
jgi:hypothetical protein